MFFLPGFVARSWKSQPESSSRRVRKKRLACSGPLLVLLFFGSVTSATEVERKFEFAIPEQAAETALIEFAEQADLTLVFRAELVRGKVANRLVGTYSLQKGIDLLLEGTSLVPTFSNATVLNIAVDETSTKEGSSMKTAKRSGLFALLASILAGGAGAQESSTGTETSDAPRQIEEIVVTAQKRSENLQDTAMSISAVTAADITDRNLLGMEDYLRSIPGVNLLSQGPGFNTIIFRGIALTGEFDSSDNGPLSGVYFGNAPVSGLGHFGNNPDIKLVDMERVEVLRGPQGTLYGLSAMGGLVRYIPNKPDVEEFSAKVGVGYSAVASYGGNNAGIDAVLNVPLVQDKLAVRAVGYYFDRSGFYRNVAVTDASAAGAAQTYGGAIPSTIVDDVGASTYTGGRLSLNWLPTDQLSVGLSFLHQDIDQNAWGQADLRLGSGYDQARLLVRSGTSLANAGPPIHADGVSSQSISIAQAAVDYDFGWATLTSASSFIEADYDALQDGSLFFSPRAPWSQVNVVSFDNFVQEVRLASHLGGRWEYLVGLYYEDNENNNKFYNYFGGDEAGRTLFVNQNGFFQIDNHNARSFDNRALFGELTFKATDALALTVGARSFDLKRSNTSQFFFDANITAPEELSVDANDTFYKASVEFAPDEDKLFYATWSEGFRLGNIRAPNPFPGCDQDNDGFYDDIPSLSTGITLIESDTITNTEVGAKLTLFDSRMRLNTSVYRIDWENMPSVQALSCGAAVALTAGRAETQGIEVESTFFLTDSVQIDIAASRLNAELKAVTSTAIGTVGDRLPGSPETSYRIGGKFDFELAGHEAYARLDYSYVGGYFANLQGEGPKIGDFGLLDFNGGVKFGKERQYALSLFAHNLTNEDNITSVSFNFFEFGINSVRGTRLQPRTIGLRLDVSL